MFHGDLAGDQEGRSCVALLDDLEQVAAALGGEVLQSPVVQHQQGDPGETPQDGGVSPCRGREDEFGHAPVEHGLLLSACLIGQGAGHEGLFGSGWTDEDQIEGLADPVTGGELGEGGAGDAAPGAAIDVLDIGANAQLSLAEVTEVALVIAVLDLAFEHHGEAVVEGELVNIGDVALLLEGLDHPDLDGLCQSLAAKRAIALAPVRLPAFPSRPRTPAVSSRSSQFAVASGCSCSWW